MGQIWAKRFELFNNMSKIVLWNAQAIIQTLRKLFIAALANKLQLQGFLLRNFYIVKELVLLILRFYVTPIQPKIKASKISYYAPQWANEYAKEKEKEEEKKTTIFTKYHGELLTIMSDCILFIKNLKRK